MFVRAMVSFPLASISGPNLHNNQFNFNQQNKLLHLLQAA